MKHLIFTMILSAFCTLLHSQNIERSQVVGSWKMIFDFNPSNEKMINQDGREVPDSVITMLEDMFNDLDNTMVLNKDGSLEFSTIIGEDRVVKEGNWELNGDTLITRTDRAIEKNIIQDFQKDSMMVQRIGEAQSIKWIRIK